jgi:ubiquinone/menaquinone biosynthesis C-methylase UbiE
MKIATGFMGSKYLFAAVDLGLFEHLSRGPLELEALARASNAPPRTVRIVADALVALGLLVRGTGGYRNAAAAQSLLAGEGPADLRPALRLYDRISYPDWMELSRVVRTGEAARRALAERDQAVLSAGVDALSAPAALALALAYDFSPHRRLLDLGGGTGAFLIAALQRYPDLLGTLIDRPAVTKIARERLTARGFAARAALIAGDILEVDLPPGHDAVLIANVMHLMGPEKNRSLLRRVRAAAASGDRLLLVDFFTDPTHTRPLFAAMMAGSFLTGYGEGDVYSEEEVARWLQSTGWRRIDFRELAGAARLIVATPV